MHETVRLNRRMDKHYATATISCQFQDTCTHNANSSQLWTTKLTPRPFNQPSCYDFVNKWATPRCTKCNTGFPRLLESPGKQVWSWKVLKFARQWCWQQTQWCGRRHQNMRVRPPLFCVQIPGFSRSRLVFQDFPGPGNLKNPVPGLSRRCLSPCLNIAGLQQGPGKMLLGSWKVLDLFVTKSVGTLATAHPTKTSLLIVILL